MNSFLVSCSSSPALAMISSFPEGATVSLKSSDGGMKTLGVAPLEIPIDSATSAVVISKESFEEQQVVIVGASGSRVEVSARLQSKNDSNREAESATRLEKLARELVSAHNLMTQKRFPQAQLILMSLTRDYPSVSVSYDLLGNISYLQKDSPKALEFYERSLRINPENVETKNMINRLKGKR